MLGDLVKRRIDLWASEFKSAKVSAYECDFFFFQNNVSMDSIF